MVRIDRFPIPFSDHAQLPSLARMTRVGWHRRPSGSSRQIPSSFDRGLGLGALQVDGEDTDLRERPEKGKRAQTCDHRSLVGQDSTELVELRTRYEAELPLDLLIAQLQALGKLALRPLLRASSSSSLSRSSSSGVRSRPRSTDLVITPQASIRRTIARPLSPGPFRTISRVCIRRECHRLGSSPTFSRALSLLQTPRSRFPTPPIANPEESAFHVEP